MRWLREMRSPQEVWLVLFKMVIILAVFSPFAFSARPTIKWPELIGLVVVLPVEFLALEYWRTSPEYRMRPVPAVAFAGAALACIALQLRVGHPSIDNEILLTLVLLAMVVGPASLAYDGIRRAGQPPGGQLPK